MGLLAGEGLSSAAVMGTLSPRRVGCLVGHHGSLSHVHKPWSLGHSAVLFGCQTSDRPRVSAGSQTSGGGSGSTANVTAISTLTMVAKYSGDGGLPWKVQWQLQGVVQVSQASVGGSNSNGGGSNANGRTGDMSAQPQFAWTPFDQAESVRLAALEASGWDSDLFNARFADLTAVLPDLPRVLSSLTPQQLVAALSDTHSVAAKVVLLKAALPSTNVCMLLLLHPPFLDPACVAEKLLAGVEHAGRVLGGQDVAEEVLQWYPPLLDPAVLDASLAQLRRLVPQLARSCLPPARASGSQAGLALGGAPGMSASRAGSGDARQLVHLLGIVMQREGAGLKMTEDSADSLWWGCS